MRAWAAATSLLLLVCAAPAGAQQRDDDETELLVAEARAALAKGSYDTAAKKLDRALALNPRRIDAYVLRASVHGVKKDYQAGVALMRRARSLAPDNPEVLTALGTQLTLAGEVDEGIPILEKVATAWPDRYQAHAVLGHHFSARGEHAKAIASLSAYLKTRPPELAGEDGAHWSKLGDAYLRAGDPAEARRWFEKVLAADGESVTGRLGVIWSTAAIDCREAAKLWPRADALADKVPEVWLVRGRCAVALGDEAEALAFAQKFLAKRPNNAGGLALQGEALALAGDLRGARAALEEAARLEPGVARHALRLARAERLDGQPASAVNRLRELQVGEADRRDQTVELGEAYLALGQPGEARALLAAWCEAHPDDAVTLTLLGAAELAQDEPEDAAGHLEKAIALDPSSTRTGDLLEDVWNELAVVRLRARDLAGAEQRTASAAARAKARPDRAGPARLNTWINVAVVKLAANRPEDAVTALKGVVDPARAAMEKGDFSALDVPPMRDVLHLQARAYAAAGHMDQARRIYELLARPLDRTPAAKKQQAAELRAWFGPIALDWASAELAAGDAAAAMAALERVLPGTPEILAAYVTAGRAAANQLLLSRSYGGAQRLLEKVEGLADAQTAPAVRCELALAATASGDRDVALARIKQLEKAKASCPFPAPADTLALPILRALNEGADMKHAEKGMDRLAALEKKATGVAARLLADARRGLAMRAAADAYARGKVDKAKKFLATAKKLKDKPTPELVHNLAVLDLEEGKIDAAIATLTSIVDEVPEAAVHLGIAFEKKGDARRAIEWLDKAASRFSSAKEWAAAKRRVLGLEGAP